MATAITFAELVTKIQTQTITRDEIGLYFETDPATSQPFVPRFRINRETVNIEHVEALALLGGDALAHSAHDAATKRHAALQTSFMSAMILAEGDSWFSHPLVWTLIDHLSAGGYNIHNIARAGDTISNMVNHPQYLPILNASPSIRYFMFSGGGNDVLGDLSGLIRQYNSLYNNPDDPSHVSYYITDEIGEVIAELKSWYLLLHSQVVQTRAKPTLIVHGYDYARPAAHGIYLGKYFEDGRGFDLTQDNQKKLAYNIVKRLLDQFNRMLINFANANADVEYVDLRGTLLNNNSDWYDSELHASKSGSKKLAEKFKPFLGSTAVAGTPKDKSKAAVV